MKIRKMKRGLQEQRAEMKSGGRRMDDNGGVRGGGAGLKDVMLDKGETDGETGKGRRAALWSFCCG